ncbi:hypothetical protein GCM10009544_06150 [Streptomyces stramineus]|uniref:Secreted protein n=1 Tax=Streptomyces stramineus TaxID=173861 RepID=A0ABN0ZFW9_9ACTN
MITLRTSLTGVFLVCRLLSRVLAGSHPTQRILRGMHSREVTAGGRAAQERGTVSFRSTSPGVDEEAVAQLEAT